MLMLYLITHTGQLLFRLRKDYTNMWVVNSLPASAGDTRDAGLIPGLRRSPEVENGNLLQYSFLKNSMGREALVGCSPLGHEAPDTTEH